MLILLTMLLNDNIRFLRMQSGLTQQQFAEKLGIGRPLIGQIETGRTTPTLVLLEKCSSFFDVSIDDLVKLNLSQAQNSVNSSLKNLKILSVVVDKENNEKTLLVPQKASAGYLNGFSDPEYLGDLPTVSLPSLRNGTFRAFEISGDSMLPVQPGSFIVGRYLPDPAEVKNGKTYVFVSKTEGIVYKRARKDKNSSITLISDNPVYPPYEISLHDIMEIWEAKAYISFIIPDAGISLEHIAGMVADIKKEVTRKD
ncbi:MAG: XRE family transcriptional regulator [Cytophagaceae bacterium]